MIKFEIIDKYNPKKVWVIYKSKCYHYYLEQFISGKKFGKRIRTTKKHILDIGLEL